MAETVNWPISKSQSRLLTFKFGWLRKSQSLCPTPSSHFLHFASAVTPLTDMMIDPRRNRFYGGPYIYNVRLEQEGFLVRANEKISLIFDASTQFTSFIVPTDSGNKNIFDLKGIWIGFLVPAENNVLLKFDPTGRWLGIIV